MSDEVTTRQHIVTCAIEDYFQVGAFNSRIQRGQWYRFENRVERSTLRTLDLLDESGVKATFFALGWIADRMPEVIREVVCRGHEIASKGYYHRGIQRMTPDEFREDLHRSRDAIENAAGVKVQGYRVADEWFRAGDLWALDVLVEEGFAYDSSVGPLLRRYSHEPWRRFVHTHRHDGRSLVEIPFSSLQFMGLHFPICGGNYFRQFPHSLMRQLVAHWERTTDAPYVMYFHVWELDEEQPQLNVPWMTRVRHYRNLSKLSWVLPDYFARHRFGRVADYLKIPLQAPAPGARPGATTTLVEEAVQSAAPIELRSGPPSERTPVTVVVPCFNEEEVLSYLSNTLDEVKAELAGSYELSFVFVDDCSADDTLGELRRIFGEHPDCEIVRHTRNQGVAAAILTGIRAARTEVVCSIDCDCTYNPHQLGALIPRLEAGVDLVTASPYHPLGAVMNVPGWRLFLSKGLSRLYRATLRQKLATYTSCFRVYRRSAIVDLELEEGGFLGVAEMVGRLDLAGSRVVECPAVLEVRMLGRSKMKTLGTIGGHLRLLAKLWKLKLFRGLKGRGAPGGGLPKDPDRPSPESLAGPPT